jgi:hypothetical protein
MPNFIYLFNKCPYWIFQTCCIISIFSPSKCRLFHNATLFGFCITHILNTGCAKIWKKKSVAKRLKKKQHVCNVILWRLKQFCFYFLNLRNILIPFHLKRELWWRFNVAGNNKTHLCLHVKWPDIWKFFESFS